MLVESSIHLYHYSSDESEAFAALAAFVGATVADVVESGSVSVALIGDACGAVDTAAVLAVGFASIAAAAASAGRAAVASVAVVGVY